LEAKVNPAEWALELERVGPLLKFRSIPPNKEWRTHLEQAQKHGQAVSEAFPATKAALEKIGANLRKSAERIASKERSLNKEFEHLGSEFRAKQAALDQVQEGYASLQRDIAELQRDLQDKSDAIELAKSSVSERNNTMTDVSPLRRLTTSLSTLRKELQHMELRIGVVAHTLLQANLKAQHNHQQHKAAEKAR
jgi:estrogen-related receptor beta like 1